MSVHVRDSDSGEVLKKSRIAPYCIIIVNVVHIVVFINIIIIIIIVVVVIIIIIICIIIISSALDLPFVFFLMMFP